MKLVWLPRAWDDHVHLQDADPDAVGKINDLISDIRRHPFAGIGKPEPLKNELRGFWARRITQEHRLVYRVTGKAGVEQSIEILTCWYHYSHH